jgi:plastocyanin
MAVLAAAGCGGEGSGPPGLTIQKASPPSGDRQTDTVQRELVTPLRVVVSRDGTPEAGVSVSWSDNSPAASFREASSLTDATGIASTIWTLGTTAGTRTAAARLAGGASTSFTATALPDVATGIAFLAGNGISGPVNSTVSLQAAVSDQYGNGVPGTTVNWSVLSGVATLSASSTTTDAAGRATASLTFGATTGPVSVQAAVPGVADAVASLTATVPAPVVDTVELTTSGGARFLPASLTVARGTTIVFRWVSGIHDINPFGSPSFVSFVPPVSAPHSESVTLAIPGTYQFFCSVHGTQTSGMRGTIVVP